jgi:DNA polymerase III delta subunit
MILLLHGKDRFRLVERRHEFKTEFMRKYPEGDMAAFDAAEHAGAVAIALRDFFSPSLFDAPKFLSIEQWDAIGDQEAEKVVAVLEGVPTGKDRIALFSYVGKPKTKNALFEFLKRSADTVEEFSELTPVEAKRFATATAKKISPGVTFSREAMEKLLAGSGSDSAKLARSVEKCVLFRSDGEVTESDVRALCEEPSKDTVWNALDALVSGKRARALSLLLDEVRRDGNAAKTFGLLAWQLREFFRVRGEFDRGKTRSGDIAVSIRMSPYTAEKILSKLPAFPVVRLQATLKFLAETDMAMKTGVMDGETALALFVEKF